MLRKIVVALAAGALITAFALAPISPADAAKAKKKKVVQVAPAPAPAATNLGCAISILFMPLVGKPSC